MDAKKTSHWPISISNGAATLFNLFLPLALVRIMPPDQVGRYKVFFLYVMLGPALFVVAGLSNGLYHWAGLYPKTRNEIRQSWTWYCGIGLLLSMAGLVFSEPLSAALRMPLFDLRLFFLYCPFGLAAVFVEDLLIARGSIWKGSFFGAGFQVLRAGAVLAAAYWGRRVEYLLWAFLGCSMLRAIVGWRILSPSGDARPLFSREISENVLRYAFPVSIAAVAGIALSNVDQLMLSFHLDRAEFAFYSMGCLSIPPLQVLEISVNRVMIPKLAHAFSANRLTEAAALFSESVLELFRIFFPAAVGLIIFSHPIIHVLFTERYINAVPYLRWYALFYLSMSIPFDAVARATGDGAWIMRTTFTFAPLSILITWLGIQRWGAMGALWSFLAVQFVVRSYSLIYQRRRFAAPLTHILPLREMSVHAGLALAMGAFSLAVHPLFANELHWFLVAGLTFAVVYLSGAFLYALKRSRQTQTPIHVLELAQYLSVGGLEKMVFSLAHALHREDRFSAFVASYDRLIEDKSSLAPQYEQAGIPFVQWQKRSGFSPGIVTRLLKIIFSDKKLILHAHDLGPLVYGSLAKCLAMGRVQLVVTLHTLLHLQQSRRYKLYFKYFLRFADRIIAVSPAVKAGLAELGIPSERVIVVPNGSSFASYTDRSAKSLTILKRRLLPFGPTDLYDARWVLCLARFHAGKGQEEALEVWRSLPKEARAQLALLFVGPKSQPEFAKNIQQKIRLLPNAERVVIVGPSHNPLEWLQASHLFISGSRHEGMPLAPLEAAGSGVPTLLSNIPGHQFLSPWARYFDPDDAREGARKVVEILTDMKDQGETAFFEAQWKASASLRRQWSETAMIASYMDVFQSMWKRHDAQEATDVHAALSL